MPEASKGWLVLKYGGTSVSTRARWETIEAVVRSRMAEGFRPFVVCSALSGVSNALETLLADAIEGKHEPTLQKIQQQHRELGAAMGVDAAALLSEPFSELERMATGAHLIREVSPKLKARVMALGEIMSTLLGAAFFERRGLSVAWADARRMLRATDDASAHEARQYLSANCDFAPDAALEAALDATGKQVFLTQGFIASNGAGETVLLGRGGSDTSAAYFAAKLGAARLEIWTDVPGMFTANPRQAPSARLLQQLGYDEAQEIATTGAKVLHPRCIEPAHRYGIPLHIRSTEAPELQGTVISNDTPDFGAQVKAISARTGITLITMDAVGMWQQVGFLADVFAIFKRNGISVDLITTSETNVTVSLDPMANALDPETMAVLLRDLNGYCTAREVAPCAAVSLVGRRIRSILDELGPVFEVFNDQNVYMLSQAASDLNLTFVVDEEQAQRLVRSLHAQLFGERGADALFGPTWKELSAPPEAADAPERWWQRRRAPLLAFAAHASPAYVYDEATITEAARTLKGFTAVDRMFYSVKANPNPAVLRLLRGQGIGFECVSPGEIAHVQALFPEMDPGDILFTPNFAPRREYAEAYAAGVHVTLDNLYPLEAWPEAFAGRDLMVRVDPGRGRGHHKYVRTAGAQSKFGVSPGELPHLKEAAEAAGARIVGFHAHVGSGIKLAETWAETAMRLAELAEPFGTVRVIDVGGGLGVAERPGAPALDTAAVDQSLHAFKAAHPEVALWMEPGRFPVATAGVLLARVTQLKQKGEVRYVGVDTGMNSLIRPALYGAFHEIVNLTRLDAPGAITAEIVGPICETGDVLGHGRLLPETHEGDVLLIGTAGAYGRAMSSHYNLRPPAAEYLLRTDGTITEAV